MPNCYVDLTRIKDQNTGLNITTTGSDSELLTMVEAASRFIDDYTHRVFYVYNQIKYYDGPKPRTRITDWDRIPEVRGYLSSWNTSYQLQLIDGDDLVSINSLSISTQGDRNYDLVLSPSTDYYLWPDNEYPKTRIDLDVINGQLASWGFSRQRIKIDGIWGYSNNLDTVPTTIHTSIGSTDSTISMTDGTQFSVGQTLLIDSEQIYITFISTNTLTVQRSVNNTIATTHTTGATIYRYHYAAQVVQAAYIQTTRWWKRRGDGFASVLSNANTGTTVIWKGLDPDIEMILSSVKLQAL